MQGSSQAHQPGEMDETIATQDIDFSDDERSVMDAETSTKVSKLSSLHQHWKIKAKKEADKYAALEKEYGEYKTKYQPKEEKPEKTSKKEDEWTEKYQRLELKTERTDLSYEDIDEAIALSKVKGINPREALNSPIFKAYLAQKQEVEDAKNSVPNPSDRSGSSKPKFDSASSEDIASMDDKTYEEYQKFLRSQSGGSRSGLTVKHRIGV